MTWIVVLMVLFPLLVCGLNATLNRRMGAHPHVTPFKSGCIALVVLVCAYVVIQLLFLDYTLLGLIAGLVFMALYGVCVVFFNWFIFALSDASMHIRILMVIDELGSASLKQIRQRFNKDTIIAYRVPRLIAVGQLGIENSCLVIKSRLVIAFAVLLRCIRTVLAIPVRPEYANHDYGAHEHLGMTVKTRVTAGRRRDSYVPRLIIFAALCHGFLLFCDYRIWDGWIIENIRQHGLWSGAFEHYSQAGIQHHYLIHKAVNLLPGGTFWYKALSLFAYVSAALAAFDTMVRSKFLSRDEGLIFGCVCLSFPAMKTLGEAAVLPYVLGYSLFFVACTLALRALQEGGGKGMLLRVLSIIAFLLSFTFYAMLVYFAAFFALLLFVRYTQYAVGKSRRLVWTARGVMDYAMLPPLFWLFKMKFMSTHGFYKDYNQPKFSQEVFSVALPNFFREAILRPFQDVPTGVIPVVVFLLLASLIAIIMAPGRVPSKGLRSLFLTTVGLGLIVLGGLPFFLVGRTFFDYTGNDSNNYTLLASVGMGVCLVGVFGFIRALLGQRIGPTVVHVGLALLVSQFVFIWNNQRLHYQARSVKEHAFCQQLAASSDGKRVSVIIIQDRYPTPRTDSYYPASVVTSMVQSQIGDKTKFCFLWPIQSAPEIERIPRDIHDDSPLVWSSLRGVKVSREVLDDMLLRTTIPFEFGNVKLDGQQVVMVVLPGAKMAPESLALAYLIKKYFAESSVAMNSFLSNILKIDGFFLDPS